jgi:hypothetical protein
MVFIKKPSPFPTEASELSEEQIQVPQPHQRLQESLVEQVEELEEMDEAERRAVKAQYYREVIHMQLFGDDEESVAYEVEKEIQDFAKERMRVFLGMAADNRPSASKPVAVKLPFTDQQVQVLSGWADTLIQRPKLLSSMSPQQRGRPVEQPATPPQSASTAAAPIQPSAPTPSPAAQPERRGRGRPRGTGKLQRARAASLQGQPEAQQAPQATNQGNGVAPLPEGAKVDPETGRAYMEVETIQNGETVMKKVDIQGQIGPVGVKPIPWPSGHSPLENTPGLDQMRISQGFENGTSGATKLGGGLEAAVRHFSR